MTAKWVLTGCGPLVLIWAFLSPQFRNSEGFLSGEVVVPAAAGISLIIIGLSLGRVWWKAALWGALALTGQASTLQWIDAGPLIHYQHYKPLGRLFTEHPFTLAFFLVQTAFAAAVLRSRIGAIWHWMRERFKLWQIFAVAAVFFSTSATVSREPSFYVVELVVAGVVQTVHLVTVVLAAAAVPEGILSLWRKRMDIWIGRGVEKVHNSVWRDRFVLSAAVWITLSSAALSVFIYERHPHLADEVGYLLHARYFATGQLSMSAPPAPDAFNVDLMTYEPDRWYSMVPPGWPAMLAAGVLLGVPWLVNPVLAGLNAIFAYLFIREIAGLRTARFSSFLLCLSPWHTFMGMNFMTHTFTLTCALIAVLGVARSRRTGSVVWALVGGLATGVASLIRPLDGLIVAGIAGIWAIGIGGQRLRFAALTAFGLGIVLSGGWAFPYNRSLSGDPFRAPLMDYFDRYYGPGVNDLGFGSNRGVGWPLDPYPGHTPLESLINANLNAFSVNTELFGWSCGSLILIALLIFSNTMRKLDWQMLFVVIAVIGAFSLYWFSGGPDFGARYWYLILIPCLVLTARAIEYGEEQLDRNRMRVTAAVVLLCGMTLAIYFPWRALDKYHHYLRMRPDIRELAEKHRFGRSLVLIRGARHPDYASAAIYNPLDLRNGETLYGWDRNPEVRAQALKAYSDRPVWLIDGPSITKGGFRVAAGPLPPGSLQKR
jgi:hypothetical protein